MVERPKKVGNNQSSQTSGQPNPIARPNQPQKKIIQTGGGKNRDGGNRGGGNGGGGNHGSNGKNGQTPPPETSPWLGQLEPPIDNSASFVEYLRWMRSANSLYKDPTKVQILQLATNKANYRQRLETLNSRTKLIAGQGNWFTTNVSWRMRVGGHKGPENILLPAFDALGMPYIPGSTLRGVARNQAIREILAANPGMVWKDAERKIEPYFGGLDAAAGDQAGKVIFLDAYPIPTKNGGLTMDMANAIWGWEGDDLKYAPNPNPFLSIRETAFVIGLRKTAVCSDESLLKVRGWLEAGLAQGVGSQVNAGYGCLVSQKVERAPGFLEVDFVIKGQLIHGHQTFTQWRFNDKNQTWQMRGAPQAEVRPTAFKSMLRYWFRALAIGVLPVNTVKEQEAAIFGAINPPRHGWLTVEVTDGKIIQQESRSTRDGKQDPNGEQAGKLILRCSQETPGAKELAVSELLKHLTWLMFHLGGIGQGARRPLYSRENRQAAPWWRGCDLIADSDDEFWDLPKDVSRFQRLFREHLTAFYQALGNLSATTINAKTLRSSKQLTKSDWAEAIDQHCQIWVCVGEEDYDKPYALAVLHHDDLKQRNPKAENRLEYDPDLCGVTRGNRVKPSPVWIANLGKYQVVTVFGADQTPRNKYIQVLQERAESIEQIFPIQ
jgi:CRISPR-associated protein Cmr6